MPRSKVGHAGTLDPLASGILIVCVGPATRLVQNVQDLPKSYTTLVRLGAQSDTLDADGCISVEVSPTIPTLDQVQEVIRPFTGMVIQTPPAYSAKKIGGKPRVRPRQGRANTRACSLPGADRPDPCDRLRMAVSASRDRLRRRNLHSIDRPRYWRRTRLWRVGRDFDSDPNRSVYTRASYRSLATFTRVDSSLPASGTRRRARLDTGRAQRRTGQSRCPGQTAAHRRPTGRMERRVRADRFARSSGSVDRDSRSSIWRGMGPTSKGARVTVVQSASNLRVGLPCQLDIINTSRPKYVRRIAESSLTPL